jgi:hypothetical protein
MHLPVRPLLGAWPRWLQSPFGRFFWDDPAAIVEPGVSPERFRTAMAALHVGGTIKITGSGRHAYADALLIDNLDLRNAAILDIGASDGTTSVDLIERLQEFGSFVIADLYLEASWKQVGSHRIVYDPQGHAILVVGTRLVAWPSLSRLVRALYAPVLRRARDRPSHPLELLNPRARILVAEDSRVSAAVHDVFTVWPGSPPDVIKVANLLRRLYFSDEKIAEALGAVARSLPEGGHLLVADNHRIKGLPPRAGLYRKERGRFVPVATTEYPPEIDDLVVKVDVGR